MKKPRLNSFSSSAIAINVTRNKIIPTGVHRAIFLSVLITMLVGFTLRSKAHEKYSSSTTISSTDASLKLLLLSSHTALTTVAGPSDVNYATSVSIGTPSISITATVNNANATLTINGTPVTSGTASAPVPLNANSPTTINILVTAQDGITTKSYSITVNQTKSNDASLAALTLSTRTALVQTTGAANVNFITTVANNINSLKVTPKTFNAGATVTVNGVEVASGTPSAAIALNPTGLTVINLLVTAQDGVTKESYSVTVNRPSTDANLSLILLSSHTSLTQTNGPANVNYTTSVSNGTSSISITPTAENAGAVITINGTPVASNSTSAPIALNAGATTINILVTAQDGITTLTYAITVNQALSNDASLATLTLDTYTPLTQVPGPANINFTTVVNKSITSLTLIPATFNAGATVTVNGTPVTSGTASGPIALNAGQTVINLLVTAQDGVTTQSYSVTVNRPSTDANLQLLLLSSHSSLVPSAGPANVNYTTAVSSGTTSLTVSPTTENAGATVTVNGSPVVSGTASGPIAINAGSTTTISVVVTAQDGTTTKSYSIAVNPGGSNDASLASLTVNTGTALTQTTGPANVNFATSVVNSTTTVKVTPRTFNAGATVTVNGVPVASGTASGAITLNVNSNTTVINLVVTAQDGVTTATYSITVTRLPSTDASLKLIALSTHTGLVQGTGPADVNYTTSVSNGTASLTLTPTAGNANATILVNGTTVPTGSSSGAIALNVGSSTTINLLVTAQDGVTTETFSIVVNQNGSNDARLKALKLSTQTALVTSTGPANVNFTTTVNTASLKVTPTADDPNNNATITVNGTPVASGTASGAIALNANSPTVINILVTAQDGVTTESYSVTVNQSTSIPPDYATYPALSVNNTIDSPILAANDGILVHQAVSPNGDGINDYLLIEGLAAYPDNRLMIMNRSGQKIFETLGYDNITKVFDGRSNITGARQLPGTYFYSLDYRSGTEIKHRTGYIIIKY